MGERREPYLRTMSQTSQIWAIERQKELNCGICCQMRCVRVGVRGFKDLLHHTSMRPELVPLGNAEIGKVGLPPGVSMGAVFFILPTRTA